MRITRRKPAGRDELRRMAGWIPCPRREGGVGVNGVALFGARIEERARKGSSCGQQNDRHDQTLERTAGQGFLHYSLSMTICYPRRAPIEQWQLHAGAASLFSSLRDGG
jgi:hypothetical protein